MCRQKTVTKFGFVQDQLDVSVTHAGNTICSGRPVTIETFSFSWCNSDLPTLLTNDRNIACIVCVLNAIELTPTRGDPMNE